MSSSTSPPSDPPVTTHVPTSREPSPVPPFKLFKFSPTLTPSPPRTNNAPQSSNASFPFDHPKADIILRSADNVDFHVFKLFLSLASPVFEAAFAQLSLENGEDDTEMKNGLAILPVTEASTTLDIFLRFCYPSTLAQDPDLGELADLDDVVKLLEAGKKYSLDLIVKRLGYALIGGVIIVKEPFRIFAIARHYKMENVTSIAAKHTLCKPFIPPLVKELDLITARELRQLLDYHMRCAVAVQNLTSMQWMVDHYGKGGYPWLTETIDSGNNFRCNCPRTSKYNFCVNTSPSGNLFGVQKYATPPNWWADYMDATLVALRDRPAGTTVLDGLDETTKNTRMKCSYCSQMTSEFDEFVKLFSREVEKVTSRIHLTVNAALETAGFGNVTGTAGFGTPVPNVAGKTGFRIPASNIAGSFGFGNAAGPRTSAFGPVSNVASSTGFGNAASSGASTKTSASTSAFLFGMPVGVAETADDISETGASGSVKGRTKTNKK